MKKTLCLWMLLLSLIGLFAGCEKKQGDQTKEGLVQYYLNEDETKLISADFAADQVSTAELVTAVAENLKAQQVIKYTKRLLPEDVAIISYILQEKTVVLDMSESYNALETTRELLTRAGLVKSFAQIDGVDSVQITVNGNALVAKDGSVLPPMTRQDFVENEGKELDAYQYGTFTLYFATADGKHLVAEKRKVHYSTSVSKEKEVLELLSKGPSNSELLGTMPAELKVLNVTLSDGTVYVNLNDAFLNGTMQVTEKVVVYSMVNSLLELEGTQRVQISINGESKYVLGDGVDLSQFLTKNTELILE